MPHPAPRTPHPAPRTSQISAPPRTPPPHTLHTHQPPPHHVTRLATSSNHTILPPPLTTTSYQHRLPVLPPPPATIAWRAFRTHRPPPPPPTAPLPPQEAVGGRGLKHEKTGLWRLDKVRCPVHRRLPPNLPAVALPCLLGACFVRTALSIAVALSSRWIVTLRCSGHPRHCCSAHFVRAEPS